MFILQIRSTLLFAGCKQFFGPVFVAYFDLASIRIFSIINQVSAHNMGIATAHIFAIKVLRLLSHDRRGFSSQLHSRLLTLAQCEVVTSKYVHIKLIF